MKNQQKQQQKKDSKDEGQVKAHSYSAIRPLILHLINLFLYVIMSSHFPSDVFFRPMTHFLTTDATNSLTKKAFSKVVGN